MSRPATNIDWEPTRNSLLALFAAEDRDQVVRDVHPVQLEVRQVVCAQGDLMPFVYFPLAGMCSLMVVMGDGRTVEADAVGSDGLVCVSAVLGAERSPVEAVCQAGGPALQIGADVMRRHIAERPHARDWLLRYVAVVLAQAQRVAACNGLHDVERRLARWLMMTAKRLGTLELPLTQELVATMLGVRRATVSEAAEALQAHDLIRYQRGHVAITDVAGLEAAACECYAVMQTMRTDLLPNAP